MAKIAASKAALVSLLTGYEGTGPALSAFRTMPTFEKIQRLKIEGDWERLNRLMSVNPEAFWYWYQASNL